MKTDIPLKRLAELRGADLLPLLGVPASVVRQVAMSGTVVHVLKTPS
jgi:hypothetical protein